MDGVVQTVVAELRRRFERLYGPRLVSMVLYGSQARGDAEPGSDIDVLVVLEGEVEPCGEIHRSSDDVCDVSLTHDATVACVFVSREQYETEQSPLLMNVRREGVPV
jgi:predicted nucleotidyltransferase